MKRNYSIPQLLANIVGYKGIPFPGVIWHNGGGDGSDYEYRTPGVNSPRQEYLKNGSQLYARDHLGRWYFMPVYFQSSLGRIEFPHAIISVTRKKIIVKTPMVELGGSVKELIGLDDFEVDLTGMILSRDNSYPEDEIKRLNELCELNESVELISALTDILFHPEDKVVIESYEFPATPGLENGQAVRLKCSTDKPFELIL